MTKVRGAVYSLQLLYIVDLREAEDEHKSTYDEFLLRYVQLVLRDPTSNVRSCREYVNSHYDVLALESMVHAVGLCKRVMIPRALGHLFCSALKFGRWYKMLSRLRQKKDRNSDGGETISTKKVEGQKKAVFKVNAAPLHFTRAVMNMMASIPSR